MKSQRVDVGTIRKQQIVEAAVAVIAEQGLQNLSLSEIETKAGMSRGQLTYYFPAKDDILLAVFEHVLSTIKERVEGGWGPEGQRLPPPGWERTVMLLTHFLTQPPRLPWLMPLQHTMLAQVGHREDFRVRLANSFEEWRQHMAGDFAADLERQPGASASPRTFATLMQAIIQGLSQLRETDPSAFDGREMLDLLLSLLGSYLRPADPAMDANPRRGRLSGVSHD